MKTVKKSILTEPLTQGIDINDPVLTETRKAILLTKKFLRSIYSEWYQQILQNLPEGPGIVLELGSGAGFARDFIPNLFTSEIFWVPDLSLVLDGCALPIADQSVKAIIMTDVLHHIPQVRSFFTEATRCIIPNGVVVMVEPWVSSWSQFIYHNFHHERFDPNTDKWAFETSGPLSGANGALPWVVFQRDKKMFSDEFPLLMVEKISPMMPFSYLLSGGLSRRGVLPASSYLWCRKFEKKLDPWISKLAMFALIVLRRVAASPVISNEK